MYQSHGIDDMTRLFEIATGDRISNPHEKYRHATGLRLEPGPL